MRHLALFRLARLPGALLFLPVLCHAQDSRRFTITTLAGGAPPPVDAQAIGVSLERPHAVAVDASGNVYFSTRDRWIFKIDGTGFLTRVAEQPTASAVDAAGNLYFADAARHVIRKVAPDGSATTVAGNGVSGYAGDGGQATGAKLAAPLGVAVDTAGNLFIADTGNHRIRKVDANGAMTTVAGNGTSGYAGDGGPAIHGALSFPEGVAVDTAGNLYIADSGNRRIRKVTAADTILTIAGNGAVPDAGDGGPATRAYLSGPQGVAVDAAGNTYIAEPESNRIRKLAANGTITTAGGGELNSPQRVAVDVFLNLYIADTGNHRVRKVGIDGTITTVAGGASRGYWGDGGPAVDAGLDSPYGLAVDAAGNLFIADAGNHRVRKVSVSGVITTVAGNGAAGYSGDGGPATEARLDRVRGLAVDADGTLYIADDGNNCIRTVAADGIMHTVAGTVAAVYAGARDVAVDRSGNLYIAETANGRLRRLDRKGVARTLASSTEIGVPSGMAVDVRGNIYLSDEYNHVVRLLEPAASTEGTHFTVTYTISGRVVMPAFIGGVAVVLSGSQSGFTTIDSGGNYSLTGLAAGGNYTLTPVKSGWVFTPPSQTFNNLSGSTTAAFFFGGQVTPDNLALGKPATQSSTPGGVNGSASSAVDGNSDGNYFAGSVTQTALTANPWWQVDLGTTVSVTSIKIWNRTDCCLDRLSDYWVFVSDTPFGDSDTPATLQGRAGTWSGHQTAYPNPFTTITPSAPGRYIRIQLSGTNILSLAEVEVSGTSLGPGNLAAGKAATQSSTLAGYGAAGAGNAVDGNTNGNFAAGSVTHTTGESNPWWQVDLGGPALVYNVIIWNRTDCCADRLSDYWVFVSNTPFAPNDTPATLQTRPATSSIHLTSPPSPSTNVLIGGVVQNRYVRVQLNGAGYLSLAEVQVIAAPVNQPTSLAVGKPATQSSTLIGYGPSDASNAVDGNTGGNFSGGSVTHTYLSANPWWQVDLGGTVAITSATIWNRTDCCPERLSDYWVFVSDTPFGLTDTPATLAARSGTYSYHQTTYPNPSTTLTLNALGRYLRVQLSGVNYLSLAEVQVFGTLVSGPPNLAMGKTAAQSSTFLAYPTAVAASAIDGKRDGSFAAGSVTHTYGEANAWWQVDLAGSLSIGSIVIWNRTDCCSDRLSDYWVFVSDTPFGPNDTPTTLQGRAGTFSSHQTTFPNPSTTIPMNASGRYVRVQLSGTNYLSLAEVEVFGP